MLDTNAIRMTRLGELGDCKLKVVFVKNTEITQVMGYLFLDKKLCIKFFTKSSGHPALHLIQFHSSANVRR
jgi:hypothetical protein